MGSDHIQEGASSEECIAEANEEFMQDLEHHFHWLEKQSPDAAIQFAYNLVAVCKQRTAPKEAAAVAA